MNCFYASLTLLSIASVFTIAHRPLIRECHIDPIAEVPHAGAGLGQQDAQYGGVGAVTNSVAGVPTKECGDFPEQCV